MIPILYACLSLAAATNIAAADPSTARGMFLHYAQTGVCGMNTDAQGDPALAAISNYEIVDVVAEPDGTRYVVVKFAGPNDVALYGWVMEEIVLRGRPQA